MAFGIHAIVEHRKNKAERRRKKANREEHKNSLKSGDDKNGVLIKARDTSFSQYSKMDIIFVSSIILFIVCLSIWYCFF